MSTVNLCEPRKNSFDDVRLGVNFASSLALLAGAGGLAATLSGEYGTWLGPAPYVWTGVGCLFTFLVGTIILPRAGLTCFDSTKTFCLASTGILLLLGVFLLARSSHAQATLTAALAVNDRARQQAEKFAREMEESVDAANRQIAAINQQLEGLKAGDPEAQKLREQLAALQQQVKDQAKLVETWSKAAEELKHRGDAMKHTGAVGIDDQARTGQANSDGEGENGKGTGQDDNNDNPGGGRQGGGDSPGGNPRDGGGSGGDGKGHGDPNAKGGGDGQGAKGEDQGSKSGPSAEQFVSKLLMLAVAFIQPELLPVLKFLGLDLFNMGVREEDLPAVVDAVKKATEKGKEVNIQELVDTLQNTRDPARAAAALKKILSQPGIREKIGDKALEDITRAFEKKFPKPAARGKKSTPADPQKSGPSAPAKPQKKEKTLI